MNKKALMLGLAGTILVASWMPLNVAANEAEDVVVEAEVKIGRRIRCLSHNLITY